MTTAPALQALIDQWRNAAIKAPSAAEWRLSAEGLERTLQAQPVVPLGELQAVASGLSDDISFDALHALISKYTPQPPNPHPRGTYLWAREEYTRGHALHRAGWRGSRALRTIAWAEVKFTDADFTATDWEVVT